VYVVYYKIYTYCLADKEGVGGEGRGRDGT